MNADFLYQNDQRSSDFSAFISVPAGLA